MKKIALAVAGLLGIALAPTVASAAVTYHFAETTGIGNVTGGAFSGPGGIQVNIPFTFDFTVASALAASTIYNFGAAAALGPGGAGASGDVLDFRFSDGAPLTTFSLADYPTVPEGYRGGPAAADTVRIHVQTDATGAISLYDILIIGRSTFKPLDVLHLQLQHDTPSAGVGIVEAAYSYGPRQFVDGDLHCVLFCSGTFTSAPGGIGGGGGGGAGGAVPEPASWALMIVGFGAAGAMLRRRRAAVFAA